MSTPPSLIPPREGVGINPGLAYVKKASAARQAAAWNNWLREDPVLGPDSGMVVAVGEKCDGRFPLVWAPVEDAHATS